MVIENLRILLLCRNKAKYLYVVLFLVFTISCKNQITPKLIEIKVEQNVNNFKSFKLTNLTSDIEYIPLEANKECNLLAINHIDISPNFIFIDDGKKCILFDKKGKFLRQIGDYGRGPGEYYLPGHVKINNESLFIPDVLGHKILVFDDRGNFLKKVKSPGKFTTEVQVCNWYPISDSTYLTQIPNDSGQEKIRISFFNEKGEIIQEFPNTTFFKKEKEFYSTIDRTGHFYSINGKIRYKEELVDTLWQIDLERKQLVPIYKFDLGKMSFPTKYRGIKSGIQSQNAWMESILIQRIFELNKYFIFKSIFHNHYPFDFKRQISYEGADWDLQHGIIGIYDKKNDDLFFVNASNESDQPEPTGIENDVDGGVNFFPRYSKDGNLLVSWINPYELKSYINSKSFKDYTPKFPEKKKELKKLANSLDENDNPVLMLVKLKK